MENRIQISSDTVQSLDTTFAILNDQRRYYLREILSEQDPPIDLSQLAAAVASRETGTDSDESPAETTDEIAIGLHHVHLPKLDDAGVIDYNAETNTVTSTRTECSRL